MNYSVRSPQRPSSAQPQPYRPNSHANLQLGERPSSQPSASAFAIRNGASSQGEDLTMKTSANPPKYLQSSPAQRALSTTTFEPQYLIRSPFSRNGTSLAASPKSPSVGQSSSSAPPSNMAMKILQAQEKCRREGLMPSGFGSRINQSDHGRHQMQKPTTISNGQHSNNTLNGSRTPSTSSVEKYGSQREMPLDLSRRTISTFAPSQASNSPNATSSSRSPISFHVQQPPRGESSPNGLNPSQTQLQSGPTFTGAESSGSNSPAKNQFSAGNSTPEVNSPRPTKAHVGAVKINGQHLSNHRHLHPYKCNRQKHLEFLEIGSIANRLRSSSRTSSTSSSRFRSMSPSKPTSNGGGANSNSKGNSQPGGELSSDDVIEKSLGSQNNQQSPGLIAEVVDKMRMANLDNRPIIQKDPGNQFEPMEVEEQQPPISHGVQNSVPQKVNSTAHANQRDISGDQQPASNFGMSSMNHEKVDHTIFKGLGHITLEGGFTDRIIDKLEENYLKCRNMVLTREKGVVTPYSFLTHLCTRMKIAIHEEQFYFRGDANTFQYRSEIYIAGFCGVGHALSSGFSTQLAAAHILERLRIFFKIRQTSNYALFPGCRYTKIKPKLNALCEMYNLGSVEHRIGDKGTGSSNAHGRDGPRYECSCVVRQQETCVRSDNSNFGSFLAARNMYLNFVRPPTVPVVQIKDYFAMGAECPMLKEIHPSLLLNLPSPNKSKWMEENEVPFTDPCLHEPTNTSGYLLRPQYTRGRLLPRRSAISKDQRLAEFNIALVSALEWIEMETQKRSRGNTAYGLRRRNRQGMRNCNMDTVVGETMVQPEEVEDDMMVDGGDDVGF